MAEVLLKLLSGAQSLSLFAFHIAAPFLVLAFERLSKFGWQRVQDRALIWWRATAAATGERRRASAFWVGGLK